MPTEHVTTHISGYLFIQINDFEALKTQLQTLCEAMQLKGTILLSEEGINVCLAGLAHNIEAFIKAFHEDVRFSKVYFKKTTSATSPYKRLKVKYKPEIITMGVADIHPEAKTGKHLKASTLQSWMNEGKPFVLLDTRNIYEVEAGTFKNAIHLNIDNFHEFPEALNKLPESMQSQPIVTFCTGGIRCEKASALMQTKGFTNVYQLDGGILQYFEECGRTHFNGECFVFDDRKSI